MRRLVLRSLVALLAFVVGVATEGVLIKPRPGSLTMEVSDAYMLSDNFGRAEPESVSPYEIKRRIDEYNRSNGDEYFDLDTVWFQLRIDSADFDLCPGCVDVELFSVELDDKPGKEVILRLAQGVAGYCRYLIFKPISRSTITRKEMTWKFIGHIDHDFNRYEMAEHRIFNDGHTRMLIIRGQTASGTGVASYDDTWYQISEDGIKKVLTSMNSGHLYMAGDLGRDVNARVINRPSAAGLHTLEIEYSVQYTPLDDQRDGDQTLFSRKRRVAYLWDSSVKEFVFDSSRSEMSEDEYDVVYCLGALSNEEFLKYYIKELEKIPTGSSAWRKDWLRNFLETCADTTEKELLKQTLLK